MMHTHPRHNIKNPPGQIVNKIETLGDYIKHVEEQEFPKKKLTFGEWWKSQPEIYGDQPFEYMSDAAEAAWNAAQENK